MRYLFAHWNAIKQKLEKSGFRLFFFDYDGTLAALAPTPGKARLRPAVRRLLMQLTRRKACSVGIISGRPLHQIQKLVGLRELVYVGNHGLEVKNGNGNWIHPQAKNKRKALHRLAQDLRKSLHGIPGVLIEDKGVTLSVHERRVASDRRTEVHRKVRTLLKTRYRTADFLIHKGHRVLEIRPRVHWGKGHAVKLLEDQAPKRSILFYIGDDTTDEDVFRAMPGRGIGVHVGPRRTSWAPYYLRNQREIQPLLKKLVQLCP
jgi:trehalose 6-phosphate phosphatase